MKSGNVKDLTQAWDLYYHVFRRISKQLPQVGGEVWFCCESYSASCQYQSVSCFLVIQNNQIQYSRNTCM